MKARRGKLSPKITRREFLKETGRIIGAAAIGSMALTGACKGPTIKTETETATTTKTGGTTSTPTGTSTSNPTTTPTDPGAFSYTPSRDGLVMKLIPGCTSWVATDRMYTVDHIWVKTIVDNIVAIGITDKGQLLMTRITSLQLPKIGESINKGDSFGYAEGDKMSIDLIAPVSGTVIQVNNAIWLTAGQNSGLELVTSDPYVNGWMIVVQLSKPSELGELITPEKYMALNAKT